MPPLTAAQEAALNLGLFIGAATTLLALIWFGLQIIGWFKPKEVYATKEQLREVEERITGFDAKLTVLNTSVQLGFSDIQRSLGRLEGAAHVS